MQDAWRASYNAVKKFFPDCKVLMCYFHVVDNIRKHKKLIPIDKYEELKDDITEIHMSSNEKEFNQLKIEFKEKYSERYREMYLYIEEQWLTGVWTSWQIFCNRPGQANTNSNIESFNATIKRDFTFGDKMPLIKCLHTIGDIISYYSTNPIDFEVCPAYNSKIHRKALTLDESNFKSIRVKRITYTGKNNKYLINLDAKNCSGNCSCTCKLFLKYAICIHVVAYSRINKLNIFDSKFSDQTDFHYKEKRGRKPGRPALAEKAYKK